MSNTKVIDKKGEWLFNTSQYRMVDPTERDDGVAVILESGLPTKVLKTEWMAGQPVIVTCVDPNTSDEALPGVIMPFDQTVVPKDPDSGVEVLGAAPGVVGTSAEAPAKAADTKNANKR